MVHKPFDLSTARVLISNDDGIRGPGLDLLERVMRDLCREVWVVAPETEQSAASHSLTNRRPLYVTEVGSRRYTVDGTPTDSVLLAVHQVMREHPPDLVVSGINKGANLGEDAIYSGTVAAAMEGALLGIPSVALSILYTDGEPAYWQTAAEWTAPALKAVASVGWPRHVLININFPDRPPEAVAGLAVTRQGKRKIGNRMTEGIDPRGRTYFWIGVGREEDRSRAGTDLAAVHDGYVAITPLSFDLTHAPTVEALQAALS